MKFVRLLFLVCFFLLATISATLSQDSLNVRSLGSIYSFWDNTQGIVVIDDYAYVADSFWGLFILDISDLMIPLEVGFCDIEGLETGIYYDVREPEYLFLARENEEFNAQELVVVDISEPTDPFYVNSIQVQNLIDVIVDGNYLYITTSNTGLKIYNISNISNITSVFFSGFGISGMDKTGDIICGIDCSNQQLKAINVANPSAPVQVGSLDIFDIPSGDIEIKGNYAYYTDYYYQIWIPIETLHIIDISNPQNLFEVSNIFNVSGTVKEVIDDYCYLWDFGAGVSIYNIAQATSPFWISGYGFHNITLDICISGNYLFGAWFYSGFEIVDLTNHANPAYLNFYDNEGSLFKVEVSGIYAYALDYYNGLRIVDIQDVNNPCEVNIIEQFETQSFEDFTIAGNYLYIAALDSGLRIYDRSNPLSPIPVGTYIVDFCRNVEVLGNIAYITSENNRLNLIDISNPANCLELDYIGCDIVNDMCIAPPYAYLAEQYGHLRIINIADSTNVWYVYGHTYYGYFNSIAVEDDYAYIAAGDDGLKIFNVANPAQPFLSSTLAFSGYVSDVEIFNDTLYVTDYDKLYLFNLQNPVNPVMLGYYETRGIAMNSYNDNGIIAVAEVLQLGFYQVGDENWIGLNENASPHKFTVYPLNPNPFNTQTHLIFDITVEGQVSIIAFNLMGKKITDIASGFYLPGKYTLVWNASELASGIYLLELKQNKNISVQKAVLLK